MSKMALLKDKYIEIYSEKAFSEQLILIGCFVLGLLWPVVGVGIWVVNKKKPSFNHDCAFIAITGSVVNLIIYLFQIAYKLFM